MNKTVIFTFLQLLVTLCLFSMTTPVQAANVIAGKILETMNVAGYTYLYLDTAEGKQWLAIPETKVSQGDTVSCREGMVMKNFVSKSLNKTFETIVFSPGLTGKETPIHGTVKKESPQKDSFAAAVQAEKELESGNAPEPVMTEGSGGSLGAVVPYTEVKVEKSTAANGHTIEEIYAKTEELAGTKVQVRGKVMKFSPMIMGRNWIHLQDGTGDPMQNSHDLVFTSTETVEKDSIVTLEGTLASEKDFGAGYRYTAIVEQATVVK